MLGVHTDGDRAIIEEFDFHICAKCARDNGLAGQGGELADEVLVKRYGRFVAGGVDIRGAVAFLVTREQGKLAHDQYLAVDLLYVLVHYAVFVVENAECGGLAGEPIGCGAVVIGRDAEEDKQALINVGRNFTIDGGGGVFDALDYCLHSCYRCFDRAGERSRRTKVSFYS